MSATINITERFEARIIASVEIYLGTIPSSWFWRKNLKPESPTQSENIMHKNDKNAIDKEESEEDIANALKF